MSNTWLIGFPRWTGEGSAFGGGWESEYPIRNVLILPFAKLARSIDTDPANTQFSVDFLRRRPIELLRFNHHNFSLGALVRVLIYESSSDAEPRYQSDWISVWPKVYEQTDPQATWNSGNWWDRTYTEIERAASPPGKNIYIPGKIYAQRIVVEILNENNPDGYVELGLLEIAAALELPTPPEHGAQMGFTSRTAMTQAEGGAKYFERRDKPRIFQGRLPVVYRETSLSQFFELQRQNDISEPFIWWPNIEDEKNELRRSYLARLSHLDLITMAFFDGVPINNEEVL